MFLSSPWSISHLLHGVSQQPSRGVSGCLKISKCLGGGEGVGCSASSVDRVDRREGAVKASQVGRICDGCVERLGAGHAVLHRTVGQEPDQRHEELSSVGNFYHERWRSVRSSTLHFLLMMTSTGKALDIVGNVGEDDQAWRPLVLEF